MDLTPARWFIGIALVCATLAAVLSVEPRVSAPTWSRRPPKQLEDAMSGLREAATETQAAVRAYRAVLYGDVRSFATSVEATRELGSVYG